jgi:hypothetical protein
MSRNYGDSVPPTQHLHRIAAPEYEAVATAAEQTLLALLAARPRADAMHT